MFWAHPGCIRLRAAAWRSLDWRGYEQLSGVLLKPLVADLTVTEEVVDHVKRVLDTGADLRLEPLCTDGELL